MSASEVLLDPVGTITAAINAVDASLDQATLREIVEQVGGGRAKRRRLACALGVDPLVLTTGRSPAPRVVGELLLALRAAGATGIAAPCCAGCGREIGSMQRRGDDWYCSPCFARPRVCAGCGEQRQVAFRVRHGEPRCGQCPDHDPDPLATLVKLITSIDPALTPAAVTSAITATATKSAHVQKLVWTLEAAPQLLTGDGARAPFPMILRLIDNLCNAGATIICRPACGRCGRVVTGAR